MRRILLGAAFAVVATGHASAAAPVKTSGEMDPLGATILMRDDFHALYVYDMDTPGTSTCYDACAVDWPPFIAAANAEPDDKFTIVKRTDGTQMWAYKGRPLYVSRRDGRFTRNGGNVDPAWHVAEP